MVTLLLWATQHSVMRTPAYDDLLLERSAWSYHEGSYDHDLRYPRSLSPVLSGQP